MSSFLGAARARYSGFILSWITGLLAGTIFASQVNFNTLSLMRMVPRHSVSIVLLILVAVIPFLIAAYAVSIRKIAALFVLSFVIAATYGSVGMMVNLAFGSASWLVLPMLLFSRIIHHCLYCWFVLRCMVLTMHLGTVLLLCVLACAIVVVIDATFVSPFLASLM